MPEPVHEVHPCLSSTFILLPWNRVLDLQPASGRNVGFQIVDGTVYFYEAATPTDEDRERWREATGLEWGARP